MGGGVVVAAGEFLLFRVCAAVVLQVFASGGVVMSMSTSMSMPRSRPQSMAER